MSIPVIANPPISQKQLKAALALLELTQVEAAKLLDVSVPTFCRAVAGRQLSADTWARIAAGMDRAGVVFISANRGWGEGVRLRHADNDADERAVMDAIEWVMEEHQETLAMLAKL